MPPEEPQVHVHLLPTQPELLGAVAPEPIGEDPARIVHRGHFEVEEEVVVAIRPCTLPTMIYMLYNIL